MPQKKRELSKVEIQTLLDESPWVTLDQLRAVFQCGKATLTRELKRHGLGTRGWGGRSHTEESKSKISRTRVSLGVAKGSNNPNYGEKDRPWLEGAEHPLRKWHQQNPDFGAKQLGGDNPIHQVAYLYSDPEYVARITRGIVAHALLKKGRTYEEVYGSQQASEYKRKLQEASPVRLSKFKRKTTKPEHAVRGLLIALGVEYEEQFPIGYYMVDFYVPSNRLVIQADGDYWHGNPIKSPESVLTKNQLKQKRLDSSCDSYMANHGYRMLRLWESDLEQDPDGCRIRIQEAMRNQNE